MDNKDNPIDDINAEESHNDSLVNNPFFAKPQDRPEGAASSQEISTEKDSLEETEEISPDEPAVADDTKDKKESRKEKKTFQKFFKKDPADNAKVKQLVKEKEQISEELEKLKSQYVRLAADFDNYRKRQDQEKQDLVKSVACDTIKNLLPALDSFDKAYVSFKELDDAEKLKESFNVLYRQMHESLSKMQVTKIKTAGEQFDPNYHEAIMQEETTESPDNAIMLELQCGYMVGEKLIRPAMVKVASNPEGMPAPEPATESQDDES